MEPATIIHTGAIEMLFGKKKEEGKRIPLTMATGPGTQAAPASAAMPSDDEMLSTIKSAIESNKVAVFMKGTPTQPMCGFSATVVDIFNQMNVPYEGVNALVNPRFRQVLSTYSNWPTLPQVFVAGKLVGGCDIVREMKASGDLDKLVAEAMK